MHSEDGKVLLASMVHWEAYIFQHPISILSSLSTMYFLRSKVSTRRASNARMLSYPPFSFLATYAWYFNAPQYQCAYAILTIFPTAPHTSSLNLIPYCCHVSCTCTSPAHPRSTTNSLFAPPSNVKLPSTLLSTYLYCNAVPAGKSTVPYHLGYSAR